MPTKLTLRLDEALIENAKKYAKESGKSVSMIVADHFEFIRNEQENRAPQALPSTSSLRGILKGKQITEQDYARHLENKHL
jgi:hypothetical protein